jgi:ribonuclease BN (tRNA processing enzyme)
MEQLLSRTMAAPYFPVPFNQIKASIEYAPACVTSLEIGSVTVTSIPLSHPNLGMGYGFEEDGKRFVFLTDNEISYIHQGGRPREEYVEFARGADLLFHDAEYLPEEYEQKKTWGHSHYLAALDLALEAGVARFGLYHHNQDRPDQGVDRMVEHCREVVRERGVALECFAVAQDFELSL